MDKILLCNKYNVHKFDMGKIVFIDFYAAVLHTCKAKKTQSPQVIVEFLCVSRSLCVHAHFVHVLHNNMQVSV